MLTQRVSGSSLTSAVAGTPIFKLGSFDPVRQQTTFPQPRLFPNSTVQVGSNHFINTRPVTPPLPLVSENTDLSTGIHFGARERPQKIGTMPRIGPANFRACRTCADTPLIKPVHRQSSSSPSIKHLPFHPHEAAAFSSTANTPTCANKAIHTYTHTYVLVQGTRDMTHILDVGAHGTITTQAHLRLGR